MEVVASFGAAQLVAPSTAVRGLHRIKGRLSIGTPFTTCDATGSRLCRIPWCLRYSERRKGRFIRETVVCEAAEPHVWKPVNRKYLLGKSHYEIEKILRSCGGVSIFVLVGNLRCLAVELLDKRPFRDLNGATMQQQYRAKQLYQLIYKKKLRTLRECAQIPKQLRDDMELAGWNIGRSSTHQIVTSIDGSVKVLLRLEDNTLVLAVGIPVKGRGRELRLTACVSSQVGCALKCTFCATGKGGLGRNLKAHEIVDQVLAIEDVFRVPVTSVAFMGMGEPLMNIKAVLDAHSIIKKELEIAPSMMQISSVRVPNTIWRLAAHNLRSALLVSLHAANQELRSKIVPSAKKYPLEELMEDCRYYYATNRGRLSFEYTFSAGVNDQREHAEELATLLHNSKFTRVNVIPYNPVADSSFERPSKAKVLAFVKTSAKWGITTRVRLAWSLDVNAACGCVHEHREVKVKD